MRRAAVGAFQCPFEVKSNACYYGVVQVCVMTWHDAHISHDCTKLSAVFSKMNPTKLLQLALFLVAPLANVVAFEETEFVVDVSPSMIRGGNVGMEEYSHHGRELSFAGSWSWSNLLCKSNELNTLY